MLNIAFQTTHTMLVWLLTSYKRGNAQPSHTYILQLLTANVQLSHHIQVWPQTTSLIEHVLQSQNTQAKHSQQGHAHAMQRWAE